MRDVDLNIRKFDEQLLRTLKTEAVKSGLTLKDWVTKILREATDGVVKRRADGEVLHPAKATLAVEGGDTDTASGGEVPVSRPKMGRGSHASGKPHQHGAVKKLTAEEYMGLSKSDKQKAISQGRF